MKDSRIRLYEAISEIDPDIAEEAGSPPEREKRPLRFRTIAMAASFCILAAGIILYISRAPSAPEPVPEAPVSASQENPAGPSEIPDPASQENTAPAGSVPAASSEPDYSPVRFSSLLLPDAAPAELEGVSDGTELSIVSFRESMLSDACAVLEGSVGSVYSKHYPYSYYHDKFGKRELYHAFVDTAVYEFTIEKVWYGSGFEPGTTILIEDIYYPIDPLFPVAPGRSYVIPIREDGETIEVFTPGDEGIAEGDLTRDSVYSTLYEFHPQITKTEDGNYLVSSDWETLSREPSREVVFEGDEGFDYEGWLSFRLLYADDFAERITALMEEKAGTP